MVVFFYKITCDVLRKGRVNRFTLHLVAGVWFLTNGRRDLAFG